MSVAPLLVFAIGNESRGDDALGPLLARRLAAELDPLQVEVLEEYQLQVENTLDMAGRELVLFIDAGHATPAPFRFYAAAAFALTGHSTHAVSPEALLGVYRQVQGEAPPPAFILCIAGEAFE
ncbi:MAG: hydrogenase maturation protease, partial [Methylobacterium sp.]|nr:hydrogenase maturation protease [Methylobacterium sp.]